MMSMNFLYIIFKNKNFNVGSYNRFSVLRLDLIGKYVLPYKSLLECYQ